jgi:hypothetical protein
MKKIIASAYKFGSPLKSLQVRKPSAGGRVITNSSVILLSTSVCLSKATHRPVCVPEAWTYGKTLSTAVEKVLSFII